MNKNSLVSVIVPTRNRAVMLKRAIKSIINQTYQNLEIIIINDCSDDETKSVVKHFEDRRIIYLEHDSPQGSAAARNTGLKIARGDFVAFLDDDDVWTKTKTEKQIQLFLKSPPNVGLIYGWRQFYVQGRATKIVAPKFKGNILKESLSRLVIGSTSVIMVKKEVIKKIGMFDASLTRGDDGDFVRRISKFFQVDFVPEVVIHYHTGHQGRLNANTKRNMIKAVEELKYRLKKFKLDFKKYPDEEEKVLLKISAYNLFLFKFKDFYKTTQMAWKLSTKKNALSRLLYWGHYCFSHIDRR